MNRAVSHNDDDVRQLLEETGLEQTSILEASLMALRAAGREPMQAAPSPEGSERGLGCTASSPPAAPISIDLAARLYAVCGRPPKGATRDAGSAVWARELERR